MAADKAMEGNSCILAGVYLPEGCANSFTVLKYVVESKWMISSLGQPLSVCVSDQPTVGTDKHDTEACDKSVQERCFPHHIRVRMSHQYLRRWLACAGRCEMRFDDEL